MLPHAIVSIDFGTEYTKVCYAIKRKRENLFGPTEKILWSQEGRVVKQGIVPTAVTRKQDALSTYGWQALSDGYSMALRTTFLAFKLDLLQTRSETYALGDRLRLFPANTNQLLIDYFSYILKNIQDTIQPHLQTDHSVKWHQASIDLVLTQPATGDENSRLKYFTALKDAIMSAGFSASNHRIIGDLEEPKAAARYVLQKLCKSGEGKLQTGDICIFADVGGGTTDVYALRIDDLEAISVSQIGAHALRGAYIGGTMINRYLQEELTSHLQSPNYLLRDGISPDHAASVLSWGYFATKAKSMIGEMMPNQAISPRFIQFQTKEPILSVRSANDDDDASRACGNVVLGFDVSFLAPAMDQQVFGNGQNGSRGIWGLIGSTIDDVSVGGCTLDRPSDKQLEDASISLSLGAHAITPVDVNHVFLTGGLGSCAYVKASIESAMQRDTRLPPGLQTGRAKYENLRTDHVLLTDEPQLCVAMGLIDAYRAQLLAEATPVKKAGFFFRRPWLFISKR